jgi:D-erythritol 1-phosphate dehydrogenase
VGGAQQGGGEEGTGAMSDYGLVDLAVIGGGINGAGIARDAAGRGLKVLMCEQGDLAEATSSRSSKLVHGGLRYLEYAQFRLVREALAEREVLLQAAPHIIWPLRFVLPHVAAERPAWLVRLGLFVYDHLGARRRLPGCRRIELRQAPEGAPLKPEFALAFEYSDCWVDDARLVVLNALDAHRRGAAVLTRTTVTVARRSGGLWQLEMRDLGGFTHRVSARALVNAAGPWVEDVIVRVAGGKATRHVRLVKGSHIVVAKFWPGPQAYVLQSHDGRVVFVLPFAGERCLIGTTDVAYSGDPNAAAIDDGEIDYLLAVVNRYVRRPLARAGILHAFAGVRPLLDDKTANPSAVTRDYLLELDTEQGRAPLLSIFGGKITTFRRLAEQAVEILLPFLPHRGRPWTRSAPLPGGEMPAGNFAAFVAEFAARHPFLPAALAQHYARLYGTRAEALIGEATALGDLGQWFGGLLYEREAQFLVDTEWARTAQDILERRTKHGLGLDRGAQARLEQWMATRCLLAH